MNQQELLTYSVFKECYRNDVANFVRDCINWKSGEGPANYQIEVLNNIIPRKRISVRGPHALGKTTLSAWVILWFALTRDGVIDWKIGATASVFRQLVRYLMPEVRKWSRRLNWKKIGREPFDESTELLTMTIKLKTGEMFTMASSDESALEGCHASSVLVVFDEAKAIPEKVFDALEGVFATGNLPGNEYYAVSISTPGSSAGRFYDIQTKKKGYDDWWVKHITLEESIKAGRIDKKWADQRKEQWGENDPRYINRVLGEFALDDTLGVLPFSWIEKANNRWNEWDELGRPGEIEYVGVDVAGATEGSDHSIIATMRTGYKFDELRKYVQGNPDTETMRIAGFTKGILDNNPDAIGVIDVIGIGTGVADRLKEQDKKVLRFVASQKTDKTDESGEFGFADKRSASWWIAREMLNPNSSYQVALPPDDDLTRELTIARWDVKSNAKIKVEQKKEIKKRLGRSTDSADAVLMCLCANELLDHDFTVSSGNLAGMIKELRKAQ